MPRRRRGNTSGMVFHAMNRGAKRSRLFDTAWDYRAFENLLFEAKTRIPMSLFAYCLMPNHWHFALLGHADGDVSRFFHWLTCTHASRWNAFHGSAGSGAVYQGRFKAIPVQSDHHLLQIIRYIERNPIRANLVSRAEDWRWSSLWRRCNSCDVGLLDEWPIPRPADWLTIVNEPQTEGELSSLREAITRNAPFGSDDWRVRTAKRLGLESSLRARGRPKKTPDPFSGELPRVAAARPEKETRPLFSSTSRFL
jgi:putative transposase